VCPFSLTKLHNTASGSLVVSLFLKRAFNTHLCNKLITHTSSNIQVPVQLCYPASYSLYLHDILCMLRFKTAYIFTIIN